jgi:methylglutaconyl-CoA hydratase
MHDDLFRIERGANGVATVTLTRPEIHNAFDDRLIAALTRDLLDLAGEPGVRVIVLTGAGRSFSAGADLNWMKRTALFDEAANLADARALAGLMATLDRLEKPTVARVNGAALGGGLGLVCTCDIAIAAEDAVFGMPEVRLGIIPAVIGPYVVRAIGPRHARRLMLTGERITAAEACRIGLVHEVVPAAEMDGATARVVESLLAGGPEAITEAKRLVADVGLRPVDQHVLEIAAERIARIRIAAEAREGIAAFLEKRKPTWRG